MRNGTSNIWEPPHSMKSPMGSVRLFVRANLENQRAVLKRLSWKFQEFETLLYDKREPSSDYVIDASQRKNSLLAYAVKTLKSYHNSMWKKC